MTEEYQKAVTLYISVMAIFIDAYKKARLLKRNIKRLRKWLLKKPDSILLVFIGSKQKILNKFEFSIKGPSC